MTDDTVHEILANDSFDPGLRHALASQLGNIPSNDEQNYYETFNWTVDPDVEDFYRSYLRNPYARAVVDIPVHTTWRDPPSVVDDAETGEEEQTTFEQSIEGLLTDQRIWHYAKRTDVLAGIGEYGVLVLEFDDISSPDDFESEVTSAEQLTGLRPFSQASVEQIKTGGPGSGRWGDPTEYRLDLSDEDDETHIQREGPSEITVHHSRVIHVPSDGLLDDEIRGTPRQEPVFNPLTDIVKTLGSSAELAYRATSWGLAVNMAPDFNVEDGGDELSEHLQRWYYGLEPIMRLQGAEDVKSLGGENIDPQPVIDAEVEAISAQTGIPQSVLKGNETGERATSQDLKEWYGKVQERREQVVGPSIIRPLVDRLLDVGVIDAPQGGGYTVEWKPLAETSEKEISEIQFNRAQAAEKFATLIPGFGSEEWREFMESGDVPDIPADAQSDIEPGDVQALEDRAQRLMNDGGTIEDNEEE